MKQSPDSHPHGPSLEFTPEQIFALFNRLKEVDLIPSQLRVLLVLQTGKAESPSAIAQVLSITQTGVGTIFHVLKRRKLVTKSRGKADERFVTYRITDAGQDLITRVCAREPVSA